jgi:hypothetical protein
MTDRPDDDPKARDVLLLGEPEAAQAPAAPQPVPADRAPVPRARTLLVEYCDDPACNCSGISLVLYDEAGEPFAMATLQGKAALKVAGEIAEAAEVQEARKEARRQTRKH